MARTPPTEVPQKAGVTGARGGKPTAFTARITAELREALDAEAARKGLTVGQVAQAWMDEARQGRAAYSERVGGSGVAVAFDQLAAVARAIRAEVGDPAASDVNRAALLAAWKAILPQALPLAPAHRATADWRRAEQALAEACRRYVDALEKLPPDDPAVVAAQSAPTPPTGTNAFMAYATAQAPFMPIALMAHRGTTLEPDSLRRSVDLITQAGGGAATELGALRSALDAYEDAYRNWAEGIRLASRAGEAVARSLLAHPDTSNFGAPE